MGGRDSRRPGRRDAVVEALTIWLASYPKSGNTWLRAVFTAWRTGGIDLNELDGGPLASHRDAFDRLLGLPSSSMRRDEIDLVRPRVDELLAAQAEEPHLRKIHDAYLPGPAGEPIVSDAATRGAIYAVRDPRDVAVSYAHHAGCSLWRACEFLADPEAALSADEDRLSDQLRQRLGTWSQHVRSWLDETPFHVELVRYEDCAREPVATFARALSFFTGHEDVDQERVAVAVDAAGFERLRRAELEDGFQEQPLGAAFFRRGESGAWRDELPRACAARIEDDHGEVMERLGYL